MMEIDDVYLLTPSRFDPHDPAYAINESCMLDWEGNIVEARNRQQILLSEIPEDTALSALLQVSQVENEAINARLSSLEGLMEQGYLEIIHPVPRDADEIGCVLSSISPVLDAATLYHWLSARVLSEVSCVVGSTFTPDSEYLCMVSTAP